MTKIKKQSYGFTTPVRRSTANVTGHKVGGDLSGGECTIERLNALSLAGENSFEFEINSDDSILLFKKNVSVVGIGGYFLSDNNAQVKFDIEIAGISTSKEVVLLAGVYEKAGLDLEFQPNNIEPSTPIKITVKFSSTAENYRVQYTRFSFGFVSYEYFIENDVYDHFPEQFYFFDNIVFDGSKAGDVVINKSCNRCQRFLPINHINERVQLSFSNHCSAKAPCKHALFSSYEIKESCLEPDQLKQFIATTPYKLEGNSIVSYYGHQLECKACKKFFVNAALNSLRTSTQHREDGLRRRAFELLIRNLLGMEWIYHSFREKHGREFDDYIWEKFGRKCFNCGRDLPTAKDMDLDHTMPLVYLYPLDETATCLCSTCNSLKSDLFPVDFYQADKLEMLAKMTGLDIAILRSKSANETVIKLLAEKIVWFFEEFLIFEEYAKDRDGKKVRDSILHSLQKVVNSSKNKFDLLAEYEKQNIN